MMPAQFQIDLFDELRMLIGAFDPLVLHGVLQELNGLAQAKGRVGTAARCALTLAEKCTIVQNTDLKVGSVDAQVVGYAVQNNCLVVTNDRRVRDALFAQGIGVISLRNQKKLEILRR